MGYGARRGVPLIASGANKAEGALAESWLGRCAAVYRQLA